MSYCSLVRAEAEADLEQAYHWYEEHRKGLGDDFLLCVEASLGLIQDNPGLCPKIHKEVRRALPRTPIPIWRFLCMAQGHSLCNRGVPLST